MKSNYLKMSIVTAIAVLLIGFFVRVSPADNIFQVYGEIIWIDLESGVLELKNDTSLNRDEILEYRITEHETSVTDPEDKKFFAIEYLHPGQHVVIDIVPGKEKDIVKKIIIDPRPSSEYREAYGRIDSMHVPSRTFTLAGNSGSAEAKESNLSYFVFNTENIIVMQSPSSEPASLAFRKGDVVKVEYMVRDRKQYARRITLYPSRIINVTKITTATAKR